MKRWFAHSPGMVYAVNVYADNAAGARAAFRKFLNVDRLPKGSAVWEG
jgi:hypothetical protein